MRAGPGQTVAGRYQVTDRPQSPAGPGEQRFAVDGRTGAQVVLEALELPELLAPELYATGPEDAPEASRWLDPGRIVAAVAAVIEGCPEHPRLRQAFEAVAQEGMVWIAVELPPAVELSALLADGPLPPYRVAELAADLAGALRALHTAGQVHGNLGPHTVLVCEDGAALLGGQALAAAEEALAGSLAGPDGRRRVEVRAGVVGARAERWAPELLAGPDQAGPAADCWALGVLLHRLLTGRGPFPEQTPTALFAAVRSGRPAGTEGCGPLRPLVDLLLAADPAARPDAQAVQRWLCDLLATAPEPYAAAAEPEVLPVLRPSWPLVPRQRRSTAVVGVEHARHAKQRGDGRQPSKLLPVLLVGGVLLVMLGALTAVVLLAH